jgi:hypothetical protein
MDHKDLEAWKQAMLLVEQVYKVSTIYFTNMSYTASPPKCGELRFQCPAT